MKRVIIVIIAILTTLGAFLALIGPNIAIAQDKGPIGLYMPFGSTSSWKAAKISHDFNSYSYIIAKNNGESQLFAIKDSVFIKTNDADSWFVYGLFGRVKALDDPKSPKYEVWGGRHNGIDLVAPLGTEVVSASDGEVVFSGDYIGNTIIVKCQDNLYVTYGHLNKTFKKVGDKAIIGELIGEVGNTGGIINPHLHFEIDKKVTGQLFLAINPLSFLNQNEMVIPDFLANQYKNNTDCENFYWVNPLAEII